MTTTQLQQIIDSRDFSNLKFSEVYTLVRTLKANTEFCRWFYDAKHFTTSNVRNNMNIMRESEYMLMDSESIGIFLKFIDNLFVDGETYTLSTYRLTYQNDTLNQVLELSAFNKFSMNSIKIQPAWLNELTENNLKKLQDIFNNVTSSRTARRARSVGSVSGLDIVFKILGKKDFIRWIDIQNELGIYIRRVHQLYNNFTPTEILNWIELNKSMNTHYRTLLKYFHADVVLTDDEIARMLKMIDENIVSIDDTAILKHFTVEQARKVIDKSYNLSIIDMLVCKDATIDLLSELDSVTLGRSTFSIMALRSYYEYEIIKYPLAFNPKELQYSHTYISKETLKILNKAWNKRTRYVNYDDFNKIIEKIFYYASPLADKKYVEYLFDEMNINNEQLIKSLNVKGFSKMFEAEPLLKLIRN